VKIYVDIRGLKVQLIVELTTEGLATRAADNGRIGRPVQRECKQTCVSKKAIDGDNSDDGFLRRHWLHAVVDR
jgi:hypothetical protein